MFLNHQQARVQSVPDDLGGNTVLDLHAYDSKVDHMYHMCVPCVFCHVVRALGVRG